MPEDRIGLGKVLFPSSTEKDLRVALDDFATKVDDNLNYILPAVISHTGPAGATGATGAQGPQGPAGADGTDGADGVVQSIVAGTNVSVDDTDPANPIVSATGGSALGSWTVDGITAGTVYQAATDLFISVFERSSNTSCWILTDSSNPPTTQIAIGYSATGQDSQCNGVVRKGDYYICNHSGGVNFNTYKIPIGT